MRLRIRLILGLGLLCGLPALAAPTLDVSVGFDGYYRPGTLVPVAVTVHNTDGPTIQGELRIVSKDLPEEMDVYRYPVTIAKGATQLRFLNFVPPAFARNISVELWSQRRKVAAGQYTRCQEVYGQDRLLTVVGGSGSTLNYANGQSIKVPAEPYPRPWNLSALEARQQGYAYGGQPMNVSGGRGGSTGNVRLCHVSPKKLPDNPEAYGSTDLLLLSSDVTENALSADAQKAIAVWVAGGGHLLVAGGGVPARLDAPFYADLLPTRHGKTRSGTEIINTPGVGKAWSRKIGAGRVTQLAFDPDIVQLADAGAASKYFGKLVEKGPSSPLTMSASSGLRSAVSVNKLKPPNLTLIVLYLIVYLILLVPVNYFVLRKLDQRELAWLTTPAIVLIFTFGAYGIGYATKGNRLVFNLAGIMETSAGQREGELISSLLLFSPVRTTYQLELGREAMLVRGFDSSGEEQYYGYRGGYRDTGSRQPLNIYQGDDRLTVERISVSQWDFRRFVAAYRVNLGNGISANITPGKPGATPRATGTVTNNTPYNFQSCLLYQDGVLVSEFALGRGQTVNIGKGASGFTPKLTEDQQNIYDELKGPIAQQASGSGRLSAGTVLVGFTTSPLAGAELNRRSVRTELNAIIVHL
ncbi:MAG: hypothetical protein ACYDCO_14475 [Armatimonadota bacterium]